MTTLRVDLETYSSVDLKKCGVHKYAESDDFEILLIGYAFDDEPARVIDLAGGNYNEAEYQAFVDALHNPAVLKTAYNAAFEITCLSKHLGLYQQRQMLNPDHWQCTSVHALYLGLPGNLADVARVIGLPQDQQKMSGWQLIRYFCMPCKPTKANHGRTRNLPHHDPAKWQLFKDYCVRDVEVERAAAHRLAHFPVPDKEWQLWHLDQRMNARGIKVHRRLVENAIECDTIFKERMLAEAVRLTGLSNPNSRDQLLAWLQEETEDDSITDLKKKTVPMILANTDSDVVRRVLELRQQLAKTSVTKYQAMLRAVCRDDRVRGLTQFYGANRTGRWAGRIVQVQNLPQNKLRDIELARELLIAGEYEAIELLFGNVPDTLSQLIRTAFIAQEGHVFYDVDFSAIEARVIAWLAWCVWRLEVFATHGKIYEASAEQMFKLPAGSVTKKSPYRQKGKVAELACLGPDTQVLTSNGTKAITEVSKRDLLWDGEAWTTHDGLVFQGLKATINVAGVEVTPDHLIATGQTWMPAQRLASSESILSQALATGLANSPYCGSSGFAKARVAWTSFAFSVLAAPPRTPCTPPTFAKAPARAATPAQRRSPAIGARIGTPTLPFALMTATGAGCSIESPRPSRAVTVRTLGSGWITAAGASTSTNPGGKTRPIFLRICSLLTGGMSRAMTWTASTWIGAMSRATCGSSPRARTAAPTNAQSETCSNESSSLRPVYDLLNAGPRNRFTIISALGPLLVHNCGYQGGKGALVTMGALDMGLTEEELPAIIKDWREANPEIVQFWYSVERAAKAAVRDRCEVVLQVAGGRSRLVFAYDKGFLFITLPSGRRLAYVKPRIEGEDLYREKSDGGRYVLASAGSLTYEGLDQKTKQWGRVPTYGGKLVENCTQAIARDCLAESMLALDAEGFPQLMTVHDEDVLEVREGGRPLSDVEEIMGRPIDWAPGLLLRADGFETKFYMKEIE